MVSKIQIRSVCLHYRKLLESHQFNERNSRLNELLYLLIKDKNYKKVYLFLPIKRNNEPDLYPLIHLLWTDKRQVGVPKVDIKNKILIHLCLEPSTQLSQNPLGIHEPIQHTHPFDINLVELIIFPLVVADKLGNRIGYGGGYYDRQFQNIKATKIGISLSPLLDKLPHVDEWDVPLDMIYSPYEQIKV